MSKYWDLIRTRTVKSKNQVKIPEHIRDKVVFADPESPGNRYYEWNYEKHHGVGIISNKPLEDEQYIHVKKDDGDAFKLLAGDKIRIPKEVGDNMIRPVYDGLEVVYLAHNEMLVGEERSCYVMPVAQALRLMNSDDDDREDIESSLKNTPAFLPPT